VKIKVSYETLLLPPPFAFGHTLDMHIENDKMTVAYELEYLSRDTIDQEEIESEGYSMDDNFKWEGTLDKVWSDEFKALLKDIELEPNNSNENIWMHFKIEENGTEKSGLAKDVDFWDFKTQELIQAIYEKSGQELPLNVVLIHKEGEKSTKYEVKGQFEHRKSLINDKPIAWKEMQEFVEKIFSLEFETEPVKKPKKDGLWVDISNEGDFCQINGNKALMTKLFDTLKK
jgi:hypothetical protein